MIVMIIGLLAFVIFAISLILGIANLGVSLIRKKQSKSPRKFFWTALAAFLVFLVVVLITPDENETAEPKVEVAAEDEGDLEEFDDEEISLDEAIEDTVVEWEDEIENIAAGNGSPTEKFTAVEEFSSTYPATEETVEQFTKDIIAKYIGFNYLDNDEEEFLTQIFKASVVDGNAINETVKDFAFDYWQVQKYVYRGAETPDSEFVSANQYQMNKALKELGKQK